MGTQSGETVVPTYDWSTFLGVHFQKIPQLKSFHNFMFSAQHPGTVSLKNYSDSEETTFHMLSDNDWYTTISDLPSVIPPSGLSFTRQQIREYCRAGTEDLTCPRPNIDHGPLPTPDMPDDDGSGDTPPPKRARRCGKCGHTGHTLGPARMIDYVRLIMKNPSTSAELYNNFLYIHTWYMHSDQTFILSF